jgi:hypothetical protein
VKRAMRVAKCVLKPHSEQNGYVYLRVKRVTLWDTLGRYIAFVGNQLSEYYDDFNGSRIISSRRVEEGVEIRDLLRLCDKDQLSVYHYNGWWTVADTFDNRIKESSKSLREAYYRVHSRVQAEFYDAIEEMHDVHDSYNVLLGSEDKTAKGSVR